MKVWDITSPKDNWGRLEVIRLGVSYEVLCDLDIYEEIKSYYWNISAQGYAFSRMGGREWVYLHRYVVGASKGQITDHINRDKLDNRRENLRLCTSLQNGWNKSVDKANTSGYKGVSWDSLNEKWVARIRAKGKHLNLGRFSSKEDAALAYNEAARFYQEEFANLNEVTL